MHCLLTGFDAFGETEINPSQLAVNSLPDSITIGPGSGSAIITKLILTTCCQEAWFALQAHVKSLPQEEPFLLILSGLANGRDRICLERFALNVRQYRIADNRGHQLREEFIDKQGPDAIRTQVPIELLKQELCASGLACDTSNYAGAFVCNETYYRALQRWQNDKRCLGVLFIHFPTCTDYTTIVNSKGSSASKSSQDVVEEYARALIETINFVATRNSVRA